MGSSSTKMKSSPCSLQLEKARGQQQRPSTTKNKNTLKKREKKEMMQVLSAPIPAPAQLPQTVLCIWMRLPGDVCGALDCIRGRFRMQTVVRQCAWCVNILSQWEAGFLVRPTLAKGPKFLFLFSGQSRNHLAVRSKRHLIWETQSIRRHVIRYHHCAEARLQCRPGYCLQSCGFGKATGCLSENLFNFLWFSPQIAVRMKITFLIWLLTMS